MRGTLKIELGFWGASLMVSVFLLLIGRGVEAANISSVTNGLWRESTTWENVAKTGKLTFSHDSLSVSGVGTLFGSELNPGSLLKVTVNRSQVLMTVAEIIDDTHLTVSELPAVDSGAAKNFSASSVPGPGDNVTIANGDRVVVDSQAEVAALSFPTNNNATSSLVIANGGAMTVSGQINIPRAASPAFNILEVGEGHLSVGTLIFTNGGTSAAKRHQVWIGNGRLTVGNVIQSGSSGSALIDFKGSGKLQVAGEFLNQSNATLLPGFGTIEYNGEAVQTVSQFNYYNLVLSGTLIKNLVAGTSIAGELSIAPTGSALAKLAIGQKIQTKTLLLGGLVRKSGLWGASNSAATYVDDNYFAASDGVLEVASSEIEAAKVISWPTAAQINYGQTLAESVLSGGSATVPGTFAWLESTKQLDVIGSNKQTVIFRPSDSGAYDPLMSDVEVLVKPRPVEVSVEIIDKIYDGSRQAIIGQCLVQALEGDQLACSVSGASYDTADVGQQKLVNLDQVLLAGEDAAKYQLIESASELRANISKRPVIIQAESKTKLLGQPDPPLTYVLIGGAVVAGDQWSGSLVRESGEAVGDYIIGRGDLALNDNYEVQFVESRLTISEKAVVEVIANSQTVVYGEEPASPTFSYRGLVAGDDESAIDLSPTCKVVGDYNQVGVYAIICSGAVDDAYDFSYQSGVLKVEKAVAGVTLTKTESDYNGRPNGAQVITDPPGLATKVYYNGSTTIPSKAGSYEVEIEIDEVNYSGGYQSTWIIKPLSLVVNNLRIKDKIYDGLKSAEFNWEGASLQGLIADDQVTLDQTKGQALFDDKHVGEVKAVTVSGLGLIGEDATNYNLVAPELSGRINKRQIKVVAVADSKNYDGNNSSSKMPLIVAGSLAEGDSANWLQTFETVEVGENKRLMPSGNVQDGNGGANYEIEWLETENGAIKLVEEPIVTDEASKPSGGSVNAGGGAVLIGYCQEVIYGEWSACIDGQQQRLALVKRPSDCQLTPEQTLALVRSCGQALIGEAQKEVLGRKVYPDGSFLKAKGVKIYWIIKGAKYHVKNLAELWSYKPKTIIKVTEELLASYPDRATVK